MQKSAGFTIIEIVVVFAIAAILSTIGIASFVSYNQAQILQNAESDIRSTLNLAKSRSLSQAKPSQCASQVLSGYRMTISISSRSYTLEAVCSAATYNIKSTTLHPDLTFGSGTNPTSFFFPVIVSGVTGSGTIVVSGYGQSRTITIDSIGGIR